MERLSSVGAQKAALHNYWNYMLLLRISLGCPRCQPNYVPFCFSISIYKLVIDLRTYITAELNF